MLHTRNTSVAERNCGSTSLCFPPSLSLSFSLPSSSSRRDYHAETVAGMIGEGTSLPAESQDPFCCEKDKRYNVSSSACFSEYLSRVHSTNFSKFLFTLFISSFTLLYYLIQLYSAVFFSLELVFSVLNCNAVRNIMINMGLTFRDVSSHFHGAQAWDSVGVLRPFVLRKRFP